MCCRAEKEKCVSALVPWPAMPVSGRTHSCDEVASEERHLGQLDDEFTSRLGPRRRAHTASVPFSGPPRAVDLVVLVFSRDTDRDEDLEDASLDRNGRDETEDGVTEIPPLENPKEFEEGDHADDRTDVRDRGHDRSKVAAARAANWRDKERGEEEDDEEDSVEDDRTESDDGDAEERIDLGIGKGLDEEVRNGEDDGQSEGCEDLVRDCKTEQTCQLSKPHHSRHERGTH